MRRFLIVSLILLLSLLLACIDVHADRTDLDPLVETDPQQVQQLPESDLNRVVVPSSLRSEEKPLHLCQTFLHQEEPKGFFIGAADTYGADEPLIVHTRASFFWAEAQPSQEKWNEDYLRRFEQDLQRERLLGRRVVVVIVGTPDWAGSDGEANGVPRGLDASIGSPENIWATSLRVIVKRYSHLTKNWSIWNEPDIQQLEFHFNTWRGTQKDFVALLKTAYMTIKSEDQEAKIHLPGLTHWWDPQYFQQLLDLIRLDQDAKICDYFFDYASLNLQGAVEVYSQVPILWKKILDERGIDKPIWILEANLISTAWFKINEEEQASWVIEASAIAVASGVDRFTLFRWGVDPPISLDGMFDIRNKKAAQALRTAARFFTAVISAKLTRTGSVWTVEMQRGDAAIFVVWNMSTKPVSYTIRSQKDFVVRAFDKYGTFLGSYTQDTTVTLDPATALQQNDVWVGGNPIIIARTPFTSRSIAD